jgi:uncharacterized membrane protein YebE (DUF533 family)
VQECNEPDEQERSVVEKELSAIRAEISGKSFQDLSNDVKSGGWFPKLLASALRTYTKKATPEFFVNKYPGLPPDAVVDRQVALAQRYAGISGGLTASAYTAAVAATIGSGGGASPLTVPAAFTSFTVDLFYVTKLQLRLAYDMSVLYGKPADIDDPEDLYDLLRVAFGIKATEVAASAISRAAPEVVRLGVKSVAKGAALASLKTLPVIGKKLLQRNLIKVGIPLVGIPLAVGMNVWCTGAIASTARQIYRDKALADEKARQFIDYSADDGLLVSVVWAAIRADRVTTREEMCLLKDMVRFADETEGLDTARGDLGVDIDVESLFVRAAALGQDERANLFEAALLAVTIDRKVHKNEREFLERLAAAIDVEWDPNCLRAMIRKNQV